MHSRRPLSIAAAASAATALLLAGCASTGDNDPGATGSRTASSTETSQPSSASAAGSPSGSAGASSGESPTAAPGTEATGSTQGSGSDRGSGSTTGNGAAQIPEVGAPVPSAARAGTDDGAVAFTEHYWGQLLAATSTGDPSGLTALTASSCQVCAAYAADLEARAVAGSLLDPVPWEGATEDRALTDPGGTFTKVAVSTDGYTLPTGEKVDAVTYGLNLELQRSDAGWTVHEWTLFYYDEEHDDSQDVLLRLSIDQGQGMYLQK